MRESPARAEPHDATAWLPLPDFAELPPLDRLLIPDPSIDQTPPRDVPVGLPSPARAEPHDATAWLPLPDLEELPSVDALLVPDPSIPLAVPRATPVGLPSPARAEPHDATTWLPLPDLDTEPARNGSAVETPRRRHVRTRRLRVPIRAIVICAAVTATMGGAYYGISQVLDKGDDVAIRADGKVISTETGVDTVGDVLSEQGVALSEHDRSVPAADTPIVNNMTVRVVRAFPVTVIFDGTSATVQTSYRHAQGFLADAIAQLHPTADIAVRGEPERIDGSTILQLRTIKSGTLIVDGESIQYSSPSLTVAELLEDQQITLDDADVTAPIAVDQVLPNDSAVAVVRVRNETEVVEEKYTLPDQLVPDPAMDVNADYVVVEGAPGVQAVTYQIIRHNGVVSDRVPVSYEPINPAVPRTTYFGTLYDPRWDKIAECETGMGKDGLPGRWDAKGPRYQGGLGIYSRNWQYYKNKDWPKTAGEATKYQQIAVAERIKADHGFGAWGCGKTLGFAKDDGKRLI